MHCIYLPGGLRAWYVLPKCRTYHHQCIISARAPGGISTLWAGYKHDMYHPSSCCQVSYIPSSGWGGSCLPSGTSPNLIISEERFSPNPNSFLTKTLKILLLYVVSKQVVVQQTCKTGIWCHYLNSVNNFFL